MTDSSHIRLARTEPAIECLVAPNPGPMTGPGTNTYIVGSDTCCVIDPGPSDMGHLSALLRALEGRTVAAILVTHAHLDHSPLARILSDRVGAPVCGFGSFEAGRSPEMHRLAQQGRLLGGEGVDTDFAPDIHLSDGQTISVGSAELTVMHTPGHFAGHLAFVLGDAIFSGDHVLDWTSTFISPPDGDVAAFRSSTRALIARAPRVCHAGHGGPISEPTARLEWLLRHRDERERAILAALDRPADLVTLTARVYTDTPSAFHRAAARNVLAHLVDLAARGKITAHPHLSADAEFRRT